MQLVLSVLRRVQQALLAALAGLEVESQYSLREGALPEVLILVVALGLHPTPSH